MREQRAGRQVGYPNKCAMQVISVVQDKYPLLLTVCYCLIVTLENKDPKVPRSPRH